MNKKTAFKAIDFYLDLFKGSEERKIKIFGGEPLLNIILLQEIITYIRERDPLLEIGLTTNGTFLNSALISWLMGKKVDLSISIDGDFNTCAQNRKGVTEKTYWKILKFSQPFLSKITFNVVVAPNNVNNFAKNFLYLHKAGVRKFNLLPAAYVLWKRDKINIFRNQLDILLFFIKKNPDIYLKNYGRSGDLFFLDIGIIIGANGDIFLTDAVILKQFQKIKDVLRLANINNIDSFNFIKQAYNKSEIKDFASLIKASTRSNILKSNEEVDFLMDNFISDLKANRAGNRLVDIKIGYQCNNHCLFCAQGEKRKECLFRKKEKIKKELESARKTHVSVVFTGGEPTLHPDFLDLVSFARKLDFESIQIQTNGRMFGYMEFCLEAIKRGGDAIEFSPSLHGHTAFLHDYLTSAKGSFKQTTQGIKNLKALGQRVITNSVITSKNYKHLPKMAKLLVGLDVDQFQFAFVHIVGAANKNKNWLIPKKSDIMPYLKKGLDTGRKKEKKAMTEAIPFCLMKDYEECIAERVIPDAKVIERKLTVESFTHYRQNFGKAKRDKCQKCIYFSICEGPWKEYPELFGWSEFKPVVN